jgi:DNA end-binding protein Ku
MLKRKQCGMPIERQPEAAAPTNVVNLMDALRRSVEAEKPATARGKVADRKKTGPERRSAKVARKAG